MKSNLKKNFIYQMFYEVLVLILPLITSPYISRVLGVEKIGMFSYTYSIATYFGMLAMIGVKNHGNREISKLRDNKEKMSFKFWNIFAVQILFSTISIIVYLSYLTISKNKLLSIINLLYIISCMIDIDWLFCGLEKFKVTVFRSSFIKIVSFISIFIFIKSPDDLWKYCLIMSGSSFLSQAILWFNIPKYVSKSKLSFKEIKINTKPMLFLFIPVIAVSLYNIMDKIMLGFFCNKKYLGYYENSEKILFCAKTVITSIGTVMMPRMAKLVADKNTVKLNNYMIKSIEIVMCLAFSLSFGISAVSHLFSIYFWGDSFAACSYVLKLLCIAVPFTAFANVIRTQYLIPNNLDKQYIVSVVCGAAINLLLNSLLIIKLNVVGACIGTIAAEIVVCLIQCFYVKNQINVFSYFKKSIPYFFFGIIMFIISYCIEKVFNPSVLILLMQIGMGFLVYCILILLWGNYNENSIFNLYISKIRKRGC